MKNTGVLILLISLMMAASSQAEAQGRMEVALSLGGGSLQASTGGGVSNHSILTY